jgi:NAD-dependent dihydropyrimidine dehydrogenase PreA subunit
MTQRRTSLSDEVELPVVDRHPVFDRDKARRAASDPRRPGEKCRAPGGRFEPLVNRARCEGKAECAAVCPVNVFEVRTIDESEFRSLPLLARLKLWVHGKKTAYADRADACQACGLCVVACPENAISLSEVARKR